MKGKADKTDKLLKNISTYSTQYFDSLPYYNASVSKVSWNKHFLYIKGLRKSKALTVHYIRSWKVFLISSNSSALETLKKAPLPPPPKK